MLVLVTIGTLTFLVARTATKAEVAAISQGMNMTGSFIEL